MEENIKNIITATVNEAMASLGLRATPTLVSRKAAAERLHVNVSTLWRWARTGYLPAVTIGRSVWYRREDLEKLERGEREAQV